MRFDRASKRGSRACHELQKRCAVPCDALLERDDIRHVEHWGLRDVAVHALYVDELCHEMSFSDGLILAAHYLTTRLLQAAVLSQEG